MSRLATAAAGAVVGALVARRMSRPKRGDTWICSRCGTENEPYRASYMNGCR